MQPIGIKPRKSLQKRHRKSIPAYLNMRILFSPLSVSEGEIATQSGILQQVKYKTEDFKLRTEQVGQRTGNANDIKINQSF